ncbi:MAG: DUF433 domain-containing protein [Chloroflexales bacterium]
MLFGLLRVYPILECGGGESETEALVDHKPVIRGLRYPVKSMLELLSAGMSISEILADYEDLEQEDLLAVLAYALRLSQVKS